MTEPEAEDLAARIVRTWRGAPPADVWVEELVRLDAGAAGTAFARLRRESTRAPSIAEFLATYRTLRTQDGGTREVYDCSHCDGAGWVPTADLVLENGGNELRYSQVVPCTCRAGNAAAGSDLWKSRQR